MPSLPFLIVLLLFVVFIACFALLFDHLFGRVGDRRLRFALPVILALLAGAVWSLLASGAESLATVAFMVLAISLIAAAGVLTPLPLLHCVASGRKRTLAIVCSSLVSFPLVIALLVNPEQWAGGPAPLLSDRVPLFGWIFDPVMGIFPSGTPAFDLAFSAFLWAGFYLEYVLVAAVLYLLLRMVVESQNPDRSPE